MTTASPPASEMTARRQGPALPRLFKAAEVAKVLDCSEWWVKEQARRGRIPFIKSGSGYRFTESHIGEILSILEQRPEPSNEQSVHTAVRRSRPTEGHLVTPLRARPPRRKRGVA
ncbi:helix-turn-helix domain-containing protein [Streptomyces sp. NPDC007083]|uniref:helix-turn-helix domain-containing protein n=1 Tax=Streptomyces sp. NPDC007083 TaxID=3156913 RepID=UPI0033DC0328